MSMKFNLLINVKMPTVDGFSTFISRINTIPEIYKLKTFSSIVFQNVFFFIFPMCFRYMYIVSSLYIFVHYGICTATQANSIIALYSVTIYLLLNTQEKFLRYILSHMPYQFFHNMTYTGISFTSLLCQKEIYQTNASIAKTNSYKIIFYMIKSY